MADSTIHQNLLLLQEQRIFFGHQSVGNNILLGMNEIIRNYNDVRFNMIQPNSSGSLPEKYFAELPIGANTIPQTKLEDFDNKITSLFEGELDLALMKFCYVDIMSGTNVTSLFKSYQSTHDSLKSRYPDIRFIHVTVPLRVKPTGIKHFIKSLIGRKTIDVENIHRNMFNDLLKRAYPNDPIFDLAGAESTYPDGSRESFEHDGKTYYALVGDYTDDGGHLNETGRIIAAERLINTLAAAVKRGGPL